MSESIYIVILAVILIALIPIVPKMIVLRVKFLRWLKWNRLANWHERHSKGLTVLGRSILIVIVAYLLYLGLPGL